MVISSSVDDAWAANTAPIVDAGPDATIDEGGLFSSGGSFTDPDADSWTATVDYGDGTGVQSLSLNPDKTFSLSHTYEQDGVYTVTVTVDDGPDEGIDTATVTVNNVAPTVDAGPGDTIDEGGTFSFTGSFTDPGTDTWTATVDYGDGMGPEPLALAGKTFSLSHIYEQDSDLINSGSPFVVTVTVNDGSGDSVDTVLVTVNNVLPDITPIADATINEGDTFTASGSFFDPGSDVWTGDVDYGDNITVPQNEDGTCPENHIPSDFGDLCIPLLEINPDNTFSLEHLFTNDGMFTVKVTISDGPDSSSTEVFEVTVNNVAPTLDPGTGDTINEGDTFSTSGSFTDLGEDPWIITADFGDGSGPQNVGYEADKTFDLSHIYQDDGVFIVTVTLDDGTDPVSGTFVVTVNNVAPTVDAGDDATIDEGDSFLSEGSFTDSGTETYTATVDWGDSSSEPLTLNPDKTFSLNHVYTDDGTFTVTVTVDDGTTPATDTAIVTVNNVAPTITLGMSSVDTTRTYSSTGSFTDPGTDTWTATVDYDDGGVPEPLVLNPDNTFSLSHQYAANGAYTVEVTVTDDDGGAGSVSTVVGVFVSEEGPPSGLNSPSPTSASFNQGATFVTTNQDIWGPVTSGTGMVEWNLFTPQTWNERDSGSSFTTLAGKKLGVGSAAGTEGILRMFSKASELEGSANVNYPGSISLTHGAANSFLAGENVPISGQWNLNSGAANINNAETMGDLELFLRLKLKAFIDIDVCLLFGCVDIFPIPDVNFDTSDKQLFSFDAASITHQIPTFLEDALFGPIAPMFGPISVTPTTTSVNPTTGTIVAQGTNKFAEMAIDIDEIATNLGIAPPLGRATPSNAAAELSYDIFDATSDIDFVAHQRLTFDTAVLVKLDFSRPVAGVLGSFVSATTTPEGKISSITYMAGEQIQVTFPPGETDPLTVTPTVFLDPSKTKMHNFAKLSTVSSVTMTSVAATVVMPTITVVPAIPIYNPIPHLADWECHGFLCVNGHFHHAEFHKIGETPAVRFPGFSFGLGPLWDSGPQGQKTTETVISNKAFSLAGFNQVTLNNFVLDPEVPPTADADGPYEVLEGSTVLLVGSGSFDVDVPLQPLTHSWDLDDNGSFETSGESVDFFGVDGPALQVVTIEVCDHLNCDTESSSVTVLNVAPTVSVGDNVTLDEGSLFARSGTFTDPGADTWVATVDWGDGTPVEPITLSPPVGPALPGTFDMEHTYADNDVYTVTVTVTDDDDGVGSDSFVVTVNNVAPTVDAGADDTVDEGTLYPYVATFTDPGFDCAPCGTAEDFTATIDWGDGTGTEPLTIDETAGSPGTLTQGTASGSHTFADNGVYTVTVTVTDDDGGVGSDTFDITVNNVNPAVDAGSDREYVIHDLTSLDPATYSDPGFDCPVCTTAEDFTATVNWGEGPDESLVVTEDPGSPGVLTEGTASGTHIYRLPGEYTVTVTVIDDDVGTTSDTLVNKILGAKDLKERAISFLSLFEDESQRVVRAIDHIEKSLEDDLWINLVYLDSQQGHRVYSEEHNAVQQLQQLLKQTPDDDGDIPPAPSPELREAAQKAIDDLVNADRVIAITIMLDSDVATAAKPNDQNKIDKEHATAEDEFAQGDSSRDAGDYDNAVQHYRKAWEHAQLALKFAS